MTGTPDSARLHIVLAGERNSGKSSLLNALAGQQVAIVSEVAGTTTDRVSKPIELPGLGACALIDTAGLDDSGELGAKRIAASQDAARGADIMLIVIDAVTGRLPDVPAKRAPAVPVLNKCDAADEERLAEIEAAALKKYGKTLVRASASLGKGVPEIISALQRALPADWDAAPITEGVAKEGDLILLVMPQDSQAPKGRLILPQQQTIRELLDKKCSIVCCTPDRLESALKSLSKAPEAIITDSQAFASVKPLVPEGTKLTSFSILLAASKGDMEYFKRSASALDSLNASSRVLIAEACTHVPAGEDIGRVKIPKMLRARAGEGLRIDFVAGRDFPEDLRGYDLIIHCGACMFNRRYVMSRVLQAKEQGVPMTNYGVTIAHINNLI